jgi:SnoaL-like domain
MTSLTDLEIRAAIDDALRSYCRGIDRLHAPAIEAAFHPDAMLEGYGSGEPTPIGTFVPTVLAALRAKFAVTQHRLSNVTIKIDGKSALVESYVLAYHVIASAAGAADASQSGRTLVTFNGRYIDRFEERDGSWRIARRTLRMDWSDISPMGAPMAGAYIPSGRDGSPDPI